MSRSREELLEQLRPTAFGLAYRMLGSVTEAEDVVQEALLRLDCALDEADRIESPRAYLATITTRLALDELRSARARREQYVGDWLPEPILTGPGSDPAREAEMADNISLAMLVVLESLSPDQRAVLLLRDAFDYDYDEIAQIIGKSAANVRQLAVRARKHVEAQRPRFETSREQRELLADRFFAAAERGDMEALESLLAHDVMLSGDGGGKTPALAGVIHGRHRVARTLSAWIRQGSRIPGVGLRRLEVNGQPGALLVDGEKTIGVWSLDIADGQIQGLRSIINPDKLTHLQPAGDFRDAWARRTTKGETGCAAHTSAGPE
jgi:RNA polymerase sigma-70 factor (ECF subfamily)